MVTFAQAQERAEEWVNGDVPAYQHREVRVREFELGFVVWAEDRPEGPRSDGGGQRLVIARDSGEATLWPALPVGEVIRRYEEEYGRPDDAGPPVAPPAPARVDLNQTSFLLSPPEWLQEAADKLGIPDRRGGGGPGTSRTGAGGSPVSSGAGRPGGGALPETQAGVPVSGAGGPGAGPAPAPVPGAAYGAGAEPADRPPGAGSGTAGGGAVWPPAAGVPGAAAVPAGATPWAGTDTNADAGEDRSVPLPETVFASALAEVPEDAPSDHRSDTPPEARTALLPGGSQLPPTTRARALQPDTPSPGMPGTPGAPGAPLGSAPPPPPPAAPSYGYPMAPPGAGGPGTPPPAPPAPSYGYPQGAPGDPGGPERRLAPNAEDIADAATSKAPPPARARRSGAGTPPPPPPVPGAPGVPGAPHGSTPPPPPAPGAPGGGYQPTQLVSSLGPGGPETPAGPGAPGVPDAPGAPNPPGGTPPGGVHHAATMLANPNPMGPGAPQPPGVPGAPGTVHYAETMLAGPAVGTPGAPPPPPAPGMPGMPPGAVPPGPPPVPGRPMTGQPMQGPPMQGPPMQGPHVPGQPMPGQQPPAYGYPQQQAMPMVGPGYQAVLRFRAQDGSEQQLIRRSAPGTPHPEWQIFHELRGMNVPPDQVLELHTELESCELPGAYCARMIREQWPQARITSIAPYGTDHASRQQGMQQLLAHQGELHQVADGPARQAPVRVPVPPVQPAPPIPPEGIAQELGAAFGPGVFRFEQAAVSRQGVPPVVAHTLVVAGLPLDLGPFFWAQAQPGRPVPTLAELAQERGVQAAVDAGSYLVMGTDFGKAVCVQYGTANIVAVPVEAGPGGAPVPPQFVNTGLPEFARCLALLGRMWRLRYGLNQEQAGRWTVDFQAQLASLDPAALGSPESWWSVLLEQMWDGLL
ncbi:SUKH-4 family immunity protein [Streptomyces sp. NPDC047000]|uniref:SUKH-4 family immunity protein n=1 Tax=Streptomyces sp. NPDC047000 TaxID=3155474 RepID=UPI0033DE6128